MKFKTILLCVLLTFALVVTATAKDKKKAVDYTKHPGYVSFDALEIFGDEDAKIEIYLKQPMLQLVRKFVEQEDPELFEILGKLQLVRVQVFEATRDASEKFEAESSKTIEALDKKGWERVVRVRENDQLIWVYLKPSEDYEWIQGIVVIAMEDYEEAVFVNIVGDIHPEDINKLGEHFDIEELDSIRYETKKGN